LTVSSCRRSSHPRRLIVKDNRNSIRKEVLHLIKFVKKTVAIPFENESRLLATLLAPLKSDYDLIIIDTVPTPSVYTNNAIVASDYVMIPLQAEEESTNNIQNYISYLIDLQEQFNPGLDMIGFVPYLVDTDSATIKSNLEELYKEHEEDNLVFQNIIKRSNKVSTWSKNGITEHKGYDKKVLSMYENVFFELLRAIKNRYNMYIYIAKGTLSLLLTQ
ncbi:ParA family protein, partial [Enterococcus gallinarum]|uniref:ParA family protein n=1 Tax=Enterococcus gallinarum TaxID=1353 RepID=UPI003DA1CD7A